MLYTRKSEIEVIFGDCDTPITVSIWCHLDVGGCVCVVPLYVIQMLPNQFFLSHFVKLKVFKQIQFECD